MRKKTTRKNLPNKKRRMKRNRKRQRKQLKNKRKLRCQKNKKWIWHQCLIPSQKARLKLKQTRKN